MRVCRSELDVSAPRSLPAKCNEESLHFNLTYHLVKISETNFQPSLLFFNFLLFIDKFIYLLVINLVDWSITLVECVINMSNIFTLAAQCPTI